MSEISFINAGYNIYEPRSLTFRWALPQHAFLYFQGPVIVEGKECSSGACILYKKGTPHNYITLKGFVNSYIGFSAPEELFEELNIKCDRIIFPNNCEEINDILFNICRENSLRDFGCDVSLKARILDLLVAVGKGTNTADNALHISDMKSKMLQIRSEFLSNIVSPANFEALLKSRGISRTQGYKLYSRLFHSSPKEDLIWARLEKARNLMKINPDIKIYEVAEICGFSNIPHFFRLFKSRYGYTPKDYTKALKLEESGD